MPRWMWFLPVGMLTLGVALLGLRFGTYAAYLTETEVITGYADRHIALHGGSSADCHAEGGGSFAVWIVVRCVTGPEPVAHSYYVNRLGWLTREDSGAAMRAGPEA